MSDKGRYETNNLLDVMWKHSQFLSSKIFQDNSLNISDIKPLLDEEVLDASYEGRQPKLTGVWSQMFGKGSTNKLLDYEEIYPATNTRKRYTGNETGQLTNNDMGYSTPVHNTTKYARGENKVTFREEKSITTSTKTNKTTNKVNRSPYPTHRKESSTMDPIEAQKKYNRDLKKRGKIR